MKKYILLISLFFTTFVYGAEDQTYVIDNFSGGIDSKTNNFSLKPNKGDIVENLRFADKLGSLTKRDNLNVYGTADAVEPITGLWRYYALNGDKLLIAVHGDQIDKGADTTGVFTKILDLTTTSKKWQFVTWHNIVIGSDGYNQPIKYDGSSASATYLGSLLAIDAGSGSGPVTGSYSYKVGCYSSTKTVLLNVPSNTITANGNDVNLSMIPICPDTILTETTTGRKIYRTTSNTSSYSLLSNGTIANNTAVTLTDSDADAALGVAMPAGDATWTPPKGRFLIVQNNRLFFANDPSTSPSRLWLSDDASHDIFNSSADTPYFDIRQNDGDTITFLKGVLGILTVGKNNTIQKVYIDGADPAADWSISDPISYIGCQAPYSAVNTPIGIFYLAREGIYRFNGQYSELISDAVTPEIKDISDTDFENAWGVYHQNIYYLSYASKAAPVGYNNRVLFLDVISNAYGIDLLNINAFTVFNSGDDWGILYAGASDSGKVYAYSDETNEVIHKRFSDFVGLWDDMRYIPAAVGGDSESPILEIARTETINDLTGTINNLIGTIDRQDGQGYYVSQPIALSAQSYDKLYWNETIPLAGGDVTFKLRTSPTGESNLLYNDDFEFIDNAASAGTVYAPNDWTYSQAGTGGKVESDTTVVQRGTYSAKMTKSSVGTSATIQTILNPTNYRSKTMIFGGYIKSANSVGSKVWIEINQNTNDRIDRAFYANGGGWEKVSTYTTISATATSLTVKLYVDTAADAVAYFDQVMFIQGTTALNDWTAWSSAYTNPSGSDVSGTTAQAYLQYQIDMVSSATTVTPNILKQSNYDVKLSYNRQGTAQSTSIPIRWRSGYTDFGRPSNIKILRSIQTYHSGSAGTLTITVENFEGDSDVFSINLSSNPTTYKEFFTNGAFRGRQFRIDITNNDANALRIDKVILNYSIEPDPGIN